jgi:hypothetical protein
LQNTLRQNVGNFASTLPPTAEPAKRGPAPRLQQHLERISALPKQKQRAMLDVIEAMLQQHTR